MISEYVDSKIFDNFFQLDFFTNQISLFKNLKLIYRGSEHCFSLEKLFETCHDKQNLVFLHKVKKTNSVWGYFMSAYPDN